MKRNALSACICVGLVMKETGNAPALRWHWRPRHCPKWAWNLNPVRRLLMRWRCG